MDVRRSPNVEEILSRYGFHEGVLNKECSNDIRIEIARKLEDWKLMGRRGFRFEQCEVSSIDEEKKSVEMQKIALMDAWARKHGKDASYLKLAQALYRGGRRDLVDHLCKMLEGVADTPSSKQGNMSPMINSEFTEATTEDTNEDIILFRCPCKQCSLDSYLRIGCPKSQYPYLEISKISQDDRDNLAQILIKHVKDIVKSFANLSVNTSESLIMRNVTVDKLRNVVANFSQDKSLSEELKGATTIDSMFGILGEHWSFFNYEILEYIIERLGDDNDKESLKAFLTKFEKFCKHKIFEVAPNSCGQDRGSRKVGRQSFVVITEKSMLQNLGDVKDAQHKIASVLGITSAQLRLHRIDEGSVILVMSVPYVVAQRLFPLPKDKLAELKKEGFVIFVPKEIRLNETLTDGAPSTDRDDNDPEKQINVNRNTVDLVQEQHSHTHNTQTLTDDKLSTNHDSITVDQTIGHIQELQTCTQAYGDESQLYCFKCTEHMPNPHSVSCCEAMFCSRCISEIQNGDNPCPHCEKYEFETVLTADSELQLVGQKKYYTCPYCNNFTSNYEDVEVNHLPTCPGSFPIMCPNQCGRLIQRHNLDNHIAIDCPFTVVNCPYNAIVGCEKRVPRKELFFHLLTHIKPHNLQKQFREAHKSFIEAQKLQKSTVQSKDTGFECDFVKEVPAAFQTNCPVCLLILREPYAASCCGKSFCSFCIHQIELNNKPCPLCNSSQYELHSNKGLRQSLYQLLVYCTNRTKGCEWKGELGDIDKHINSNPSPSTQLNGCQFAAIKCNYCSGGFQRSSIPKHQSKQCPKRLISCPLKCGKEFEYNNLERHILSDCLASIPTPTFSQSISIEDVFRWISKGEFKDQETLLCLQCSMNNRQWNCDVQNNDGDTALHLACRANRLSIVEFLLSNMRSNPNILNNSGKAPIQLTNNLIIISQLIQYEAKFTTIDVKRWAKQFGLPKVAEIITLGDPNRKTTEGDTALHIACVLDTCDVVRCLLVEKHCYPDLKNSDEKTAIELTVNYEVTKLLVENAATVLSQLVTFWLKQEDRDLRLKLIESLVRVNPNFKTSDGDSILHLTCKHGSCHMVDYLLDMYKCDPNIQDAEGKTPIQVTPKSDLNTIEVLITHDAITNSDITFTLVCNASCNADIFLKSLKNGTWKPDDRTGNGNTALHLACEHDILKIVRILLSEARCDPNKENNAEKTPFQLCKDPDIMQELIRYGAILQSDDLFYLITRRNITPDRIVAILRLAVEKMAWNPHELLSSGDSMLHLACLLDMYELVHYLLSDLKSNPDSKNHEGEAPIAYTEDINIIKELIKYNAVTSSREVFMLIESTAKECEGETVELLQTLLQHTTWNPDDKSSEGDTALHLACIVNAPVIMEFLLSEANCNPNISNACGNIPFETTSDPLARQLLISYGTKINTLYKSHHKELGTSEPLKPPVKIFVIGDPSVGKSTLIAALQDISYLFWSKKISNVSPKTTGVIPYDFDSKHFGPVTFHDFAGQREFYSSHAALLQIAVQQSSTSIFLLVVNLGDSNYDRIRQSMFYWFSFLENQCTLVDCKPNIIVVGSHIDVLKTTFFRDNFAKMCLSYPFVNLEFIEFIPMDCQHTKSAGMTELQHHLSLCCSKLRTKENITFNAHWFYVYLSKIKFTFGKLGSVHENIKIAGNDMATRYIPRGLGALYKICMELNDRGHILFLKHPSEAENSWIVFDKNTILSNVIGTIFAPESFPDHKFLASSTGVVPLSKLKTHFPQYNSEVLIGFLTHLEFCHEISDQELLHYISEQYSPTSRERYYLFPGLIAQGHDSLTQEMDNIDCGWILQCKKSHQFFDSRFLQVLLLRLAFTSALVKEPQKEIPAIQRKCFLWKTGVFWRSRDEVKVLVEVSSDTKAVVILMQHTRFSSLHSSNLQAQVICKVFQCVKENCPCLELTESLIIPCQKIQYPLKDLSDLTLVSIQNVAQAAIRPYSRTSVIEKLPLFEPYISLGTNLVNKLMNQDAVTMKEIIPHDFFVEFALKIAMSKGKKLFFEIFESESLQSAIETVYDDVWDISKLSVVQRIILDQAARALQESLQRDGCEGTYSDLRHKLEQFSIFSGRNILEIAEQEPSYYISNRWSRASDTDADDTSDNENDWQHKQLLQSNIASSCLTDGAVDSVDPGESGLSSDMLKSIAMGGGAGGVSTDYSGLASADEEMAKEASRSHIDSPELDHREFEDEDVDSQKWCQHSKHVFILSLFGKPVYCRYGKVDKLVNLFGILQALVAFVQDDKDDLRSIVSGNHQFVFVCRRPLLLVAVSQTCQSVSQLTIQLEYAYNQILSVSTNTQLQQIFEENPWFDLGLLLQGSEKFVDNILNMTDTDPSLIFAGVRCLSMPPSLRQNITNIIIRHRNRDVLFAVLVANNQVITFIRPKEYSLLPLDIHLILNLVDSSISFRSAESWTPICLPKFNDTGFLHAHVSYLPNDSPACLLLFSTDKEKFFSLHECQQRIVEKLEKQGCLESIKQAVIESEYDVDHLQAPELRHFIYKSRKTSSMTSPRIPDMYVDTGDQERLFELYMFMQQKIHSPMLPTKTLYHMAHKEAMLGWRASEFDLYAVFNPLIAKTQAILLGNKLVQWINREEERLIITSSYTY